MLKLTAPTLDLLKNFASINPNLVIKEGSKFGTISEAKNIMATAQVTETFDTTFGIYDLNEFITALGLIDDPGLTFTEDSVNISSEKKEETIKYRFANPAVLTTPQKEIKMPSADLTLVISADCLSKIRKAASVLGHSILAIQGSPGSKVELSIRDPKDSSSNTYTATLDVKHELDQEFSFEFLISNLKLLGGDYKVEISSKLISHWTHASVNVAYFIALEKSSTFGQQKQTAQE